IQGELYARPDPGGARVEERAVSAFDKEAFVGKRPSHVGYGGHYVADAPLLLPAAPGERVRLFVLNPGPHLTAQITLQGLPFTSVSPADRLTNGKGPVTLAPGQGAVVEMTVTKRGRYRLADQQMGARGLVAIIDAAPGEKSAPLVALAPPRTPAERRSRAHDLYLERCVSCHDPQPGMMRLAPDLLGIHKRRSREWLVQWLTDPPKMQASDATAKDLLREWNNLPMPNVMLSADQIDWMLEYLAALPVKKG
ncbi:MAG TPA: c-type cytochrome, partial [Polyangia bacterium]